MGYFMTSRDNYSPEPGPRAVAIEFVRVSGELGQGRDWEVMRVMTGEGLTQSEWFDLLVAVLEVAHEEQPSLITSIGSFAIDDLALQDPSVIPRLREMTTHSPAISDLFTRMANYERDMDVTTSWWLP